MPPYDMLVCVVGQYMHGELCLTSSHRLCELNSLERAVYKLVGASYIFSCIYRLVSCHTFRGCAKY